MKYRVRGFSKGTSTIKSLLMHPKDQIPKCKVRIPTVFNKLLKLPRQLEPPHSSIPTPKGDTFFIWSFNTEDN